MSETMRVTCLDRARVALEQTGQQHCASVMKSLQEAINDASELTGLDSNLPVKIVRDLIGAVQVALLFKEDDDV